MKRRWITLPALLLIVILFSGCTVGNHPEHLLNGGSSLNALPATPAVSIPFSAVFCRGSLPKDDQSFEGLRVIGSTTELDAYRQEYWPTDSYDQYHQLLENGQTVAAQFDSYDAAFFAEHLLVIAFVEEGSGSIRHEVVCCTTASSGSEITIRSFNPNPDGIGTCDMAYWHIPIALKRADLKSLDFSLSLTLNEKTCR